MYVIMLANLSIFHLLELY